MRGDLHRRHVHQPYQIERKQAPDDERGDRRRESRDRR